MKLWLIAVGHKMPVWISTGFTEYAKRMPREAKIELLEIKPEPRTSGKNVIQMMAAEAQRILAAIPPNSRHIVLDEHGTMLSTKQMAQHMQEWL
ncbi:MAG: 23S rRNA (pseudouridine(1915)-N(3))-methyltransferase RlmH, partial [Candidatus Nitrotoga sp.]